METGFNAAVLDDGTEITADACVTAVPHDVLLNLLPQEVSEPDGPLEGLRHIKTSPITGVHLWYDRQVMAEPFLTLLDHTTQWVFNKTLLYRPGETNGHAERPSQKPAAAADAEGQYLQLVISASYDLVPRSRQEIIDMCRRELAMFCRQRRKPSCERPP